MVEEECWDSGWIWGMKWERLDGLEGAWFQGEKEGEVLWNSEGEVGGLLGSSLWTSALSLGWQKESIEEGRKLRLYLLLSSLLARSGIQVPPVPSTAAEGDEQPAR